MNGINNTVHFLDNIFQDEQCESLEQQHAYEAQARYESMVVNEARAIVEESISMPATKEHLRVVLEWLDGTRVRLHQAQPEADLGENTPPF